jgi:hypothetical protein
LFFFGVLSLFPGDFGASCRLNEIRRDLIAKEKILPFDVHPA